MKTNKITPLFVSNLIADDAPLQATWPTSQVQSSVPVPTVENLKKRIQKILVALLKETWLPIALCVHIAKQVADLGEILNCQNLSNSSTHYECSTLHLLNAGNVWQYSFGF